MAASRTHAGVLWTHNDSGGDPALYAIDAAGKLLGETRIGGATNQDWEDIALAPCAAGSCLYIADTGDNAHDRNELVIYRLPEPSPAQPEALAESFPVRFPSGNPDVEAIFVLPNEAIFLVTRGRGDDQAIYRYPLPLRPSEVVTLEHLANLGGEPRDNTLHITAASASPSGEWVAIRQYKRLAIYRTEQLLNGNTTPAVEFDLTAVGEVQGEAVQLLDNGGVVLTSEAGFAGSSGTIAVLQCELPSVTGAGS